MFLIMKFRSFSLGPSEICTATLPPGQSLVIKMLQVLTSLGRPNEHGVRPGSFQFSVVRHHIDFVMCVVDQIVQHCFY